jgi:hydrogenase maturation factor
MHEIRGELVAIEEREGRRLGQIRVGAARIAVRLDLVPEAVAGDTVIASAGVALRIEAPKAGEES